MKFSEWKEAVIRAVEHLSAFAGGTLQVVAAEVVPPGLGIWNEKSPFWRATQPRFIKGRTPPMLCVAGGQGSKRRGAGTGRGEECGTLLLQTLIGHNESGLVTAVDHLL